MGSSDLNDWINRGADPEALAEERARTVRQEPGGPPEPPPWDDVSPEAALPQGRPRIRTGPLLDVMRAEGLAALVERDRSIYQRGGRLVSVVSEPTPGAPARHRIHGVDVHDLRARLSRAAEWIGTKRDGELVQVPPPRDVALALLGAGEWPGVRPLEGVIDAPALRPDGTILQDRGYDEATGLYYPTSAPPFPRVPDRPDHNEARRARDLLLDVVQDFNFESNADRAAWLAAVLTPFARSAIAGNVPLFVVEAPLRGTGKTLLAQVAAIIATGAEVAVTPAPPDDDECRKRITALGMKGQRIVLLDNVAGPFGWPSLDAALTSPEWSERMLGGNTITTMRLGMTWYATANNPTYAGDVLRRMLRVRLVSPSERPEERDGFEYPDLGAHVRRERVRLAVAALTILRAYVVAGRPDQSLTAWGSFEGWSALVRGALVWLGEVDPHATHAELLDRHDYQRAELVRLLAAWRAHLGDRAVTASDLRRLLAAPPREDAAPEDPTLVELREAVRDAFGSRGDLPSSKALGRRLAARRGTPAGGLRLADQLGERGSGGALLWRVEDVQTQASAAA